MGLLDVQNDQPSVPEVPVVGSLACTFSQRPCACRDLVLALSVAPPPDPASAGFDRLQRLACVRSAFASSLRIAARIAAVHHGSRLHTQKAAAKIAIRRSWLARTRSIWTSFKGVSTDTLKSAVVQGGSWPLAGIADVGLRRDDFDGAAPDAARQPPGNRLRRVWGRTLVRSGNCGATGLTSAAAMGNELYRLCRQAIPLAYSMLLVRNRSLSERYCHGAV